MNRKRVTLIGSFALLLALLLSSTIPVHSAQAESGGGTGTLTADGDGLAGIRGNGTVTISGNGILWIRDRAGDADINISGNGLRTERPGNWIRYSGFNGSAEVTGSRIAVALSGYDIHLEAAGTGVFVLRGNGSYAVSKDGETILEGSWTEEADVQRIP